VRELVKRLGWRVFDVYVDNDKSAYDLNVKRVEYERMIADIKAGRIQAIAAYHSDRIHRRLSKLVELIEILDRYSVQVSTCVAGTIDLTEPMGRLLAHQWGMIAEMESRLKSRRVADKVLEIAKSGGNHGGPRPFGFRPGGMEIDEAEAQHIRKWAAGVLEGRPLRHLALDAAGAGVSTPRGLPWTYGAIRNVLLSPRVVGRRQYQGKDAFDAQWPAILDEQTWNAVRVVLSDPKRKCAQGASYLLTGLLFTPDGKRLRGGRSHNQTAVYQVIPGAKVQAEQADDEVIAACFDATDRLILQKPTKANKRVVQSIERKALRIKADMDVAMRAHDREEMRTAELVRTLHPLTAQLDETERALTAALIDSHIKARPDWMNRPGAMRELWLIWTSDERREALRDLIERIVVLPGRGPVADRLQIAWRA